MKKNWIWKIDVKKLSKFDSPEKLASKTTKSKKLKIWHISYEMKKLKNKLIDNIGKEKKMEKIGKSEKIKTFCRFDKVEQ